MTSAALTFAYEATKSLTACNSETCEWILKLWNTLKLEMLTLNNRIYSNGIQLFLVEIVYFIEAVLPKIEQKWPFFGFFRLFSTKPPPNLPKFLQDVIECNYCKLYYPKSRYQALKRAP